jgi:hypothetical protein
MYDPKQNDLLGSPNLDQQLYDRLDFLRGDLPSWFGCCHCELRPMCCKITPKALKLSALLDKAGSEAEMKLRAITATFDAVMGVPIGVSTNARP